jgi:hypothetical protein
MKKLEFEKVWNDLLEVLEPGMIVYTLVRTYGNKIERIDDEGIWVMTRKSRPDSSLVPKSMFKEAIEYLMQHGELSHAILTEDLRIVRSAFILAALCKLSYVEQEPDKARIYLK